MTPWLRPEVETAFMTALELSEAEQDAYLAREYAAAGYAWPVPLGASRWSASKRCAPTQIFDEQRA